MIGCFTVCAPLLSLGRRAPAGLHDDLIEQQIERRQQKQHRYHADQRSPRHQAAEGADHVHIGIDAHADGRREKAQRARKDRGHGRGQSGDGRRCFVVPQEPFMGVPLGHKDRVVHRRAELDRADHDGRHKGQRLSRIAADAHVDVDRKLDHQHQDDGQYGRVQNEQDDEKDRADGYRADHFEVRVRDADKIPRAGRLADKHGGGVIPLQDRAQLVDLRVHLVAGDGIFRGDQHELPPAARKLARQLLRQPVLRDTGADERIRRQGKLHAVHGLHLLQHGLDFSGREIIVRQDQMDRAHVELLLQLRFRLDGGKIVRQAGVQVIIHIHVFITDQRRYQEQQHHDHEHLVVLYHEPRELFAADRQRPVTRFGDHPFGNEDHGGQHGDAGDDAQQHALGHDDAQIHAQCKGHKAHGNETGDRRPSADISRKGP